MGNCINKNRLYVLATCNFRNGSQEYIQGPNNDANVINRPPPSGKYIKRLDLDYFIYMLIS